MMKKGTKSVARYRRRMDICMPTELSRSRWASTRYSVGTDADGFVYAVHFSDLLY